MSPDARRIDAGFARKFFDDLIFEGEAARRFTQDSPVLPDVWIRFGMRALGFEKQPLELELLLTPHRDVTAAELAANVKAALAAHDTVLEVAPGGRPRYAVAYTQSTVAVCVDLARVCAVLMPLSEWWRKIGFTRSNKESPPQSLVAAVAFNPLQREALIERMKQLALRSPLGEQDGEEVEEPAKPLPVEPLSMSPAFVLLVRVVGMLALAIQANEEGREDFLMRRRPAADVVDAFVRTMRSCPREPKKALLWTISMNRPVKTSVCFSALAVKADAARSLFNLRCDKLAWAVIDTGVDAKHLAFRTRRDGKPIDGTSRVKETYDFTEIRQILADPQGHAGAPAADPLAQERAVRDAQRSLRAGRTVDWSILQPLIAVRHDAHYRPPEHEHGTHVAGILAGDFRREDAPDLDLDGDLIGVSPDLVLYDLRVLDKDGRGNEFSILAALQFVRWFNSIHDQPKIHGVNLSLSLKHDVANYACGQTPICDECERLVASGVVVVAAAGNDGYTKFSTPTGDAEGYRSMSISDPGNADGVITVGATHRNKPHTYGVSYFSSRGPTGDGRIKPDLVAPGEKITAPVLDGVGTKDGTSMAAPHVSGAAALLLARHRELLGNPRRIKEILCATATDLRRERYFQGAGMVDILRALQSV